MDVVEAINQRKSVRAFTKEEVPVEMVESIIECARLAPSGFNAQPWKFYAVSSPEVKEKLKKEGAFRQDFVYEAPLIIACSTNPADYEGKKVPGAEEQAVYNLGIASGFLVLRATELGLSSCYIAYTDEKKLKKVLGIPEEYRVPFVIIMGFPAEEGHERERKCIGDILEMF